MSNYKKVNVPKKNLPNDIDSSEFKKVWLEAFSMEPDKIEALFKILKSFFKSSLGSLFNTEQPDYFLISILSYIDSDIQLSLNKLKNWLSNHDFYHELRVIIFLRLNNLKKPSKRIRPIMAEYFFIQDIKYALSKEIKKHSKVKPSFCVEHDYTYIEEIVETTGNPWYDYLLKLYSLGYNNTEISNLTNMSRKTIINEGKKICLCLNLKQSKN